jgi:hypothetical protein
MRLKNFEWKQIVGAAAAMLWVSGVQAQANPEGGDVAPPAGAAASGTASGSASATTSWPSPSASAEGSAETSGTSDPAAAANNGEGDHAAVVSHLGIGFFGIEELPFPDTTVANPNAATLSAPTIGVRYWLSDMLGIEAALGLNITSEDVDATTERSGFGIALHGGVPLALAASGHFVFEIVPLINFGITSGSVDVTNAAGMTATTDLSGLFIEVGARAGAEIHFGFMDLPNLALQGTLGLSVRHASRTVTPPGGTDFSIGSTVVSTTVGNEPWDIFNGNITAIYYL